MSGNKRAVQVLTLSTLAKIVGVYVEYKIAVERGKQ